MYTCLSVIFLFVNLRDVWGIEKHLLLFKGRDVYMMTEKVTTGISSTALQHLLQIAGEVSPQTDATEAVFELLKGEYYILRYPQATQQMNYIGAFIQSPKSNNYIQLLLEVDEQVTIEDVQLETNIEEEELLRVELEFTLNKQHHFSNEFWQSYLKLPIDVKQQQLQTKLQSWSLYIDFLLKSMDYPFTIDTVQTLGENNYQIQLMVENKISDFEITPDFQLFHQQAFQEEQLAQVIEWDVKQHQLVVTSEQNLMKYERTEIHIYSLTERQNLKLAKENLRLLINQIEEKPTLNHPLLNNYLSQSATSNFSGYVAKQEEVATVIEQMVNNAVNEFSSITICINDEQLEKKLQQDYIHLLPISADNNVNDALIHVKKALLEKSSIKRMEIENFLSQQEKSIQKRSIDQQQQRINNLNAEIAKIQAVEKYLVGENDKSDEKIKVFSNLITSYQNEQEQLAFRNDQLINAKVDLEDSMLEQQQLLGKIKVQQQEDKIYYEELEKKWLIFNKESTIYTDHIVAQKNMTKAEKVIEDCQQKIEKIKVQQVDSEQVLQEMTEALQLFKENQRVEQVEIISGKIRKAAEFLNQPQDLQFAYSYVELTTIYMDKYEEIETLQRRFIEDNQIISEELLKLDVQLDQLVTTPYNYDRHYMEEKMNQVLFLIDNKPITLGINYKSKQRWKEQLVTAVEDLRSMELAMDNEKNILESKLMTQLQYAEQLQVHFEEDTNSLRVDIQAQQVTFEESHQQYIDIIAAAKQEIEEMKIEIKKGLQSTKGRSEIYDSLTELEKARKGFKAELLAKYEALENQVSDLEKVSKYIEILKNKHEQKEQEVMTDKREMNTQIDVLQHDIVNSKTSIENLNKAKYLAGEQQQELQQQIEKYQQTIEIAKNIQSNVKADLAWKNSNEKQAKNTLQEVKKWHAELLADKVTPQWRAYIEQNSKLRFVRTLQEVANVETDIIILEDQQYSWLEVLLILTTQPRITFVTTNISERISTMNDSYANYLQFENKGILQRQNLLEVLKENPLENYVETYENIEQPYLVVNKESKMSS